MFRNWKFEEGSVTLEPGDRIVLYTDGVTELNDDTEEEFSEERLISLLCEGRAKSAAALKDSVLQAIARYNAGEYQDDITVVVIAID